MKAIIITDEKKPLIVFIADGKINDCYEVEQFKLIDKYTNLSKEVESENLRLAV